MNVYRIKILKISGSSILNESTDTLAKCIIYKSKANLTEKEVFNKAAKYIHNKYGVVLEAADISSAEYYRDKNHVPYWAAEALNPLDDKKIKYVISVLIDVNGSTDLEDVMSELIDQYGPEVDSLDMEEKVSKCAYQMVRKGEIEPWAWMG